MRYHLSSAAPLIPVRVRSPIVQIPTANTTNRTIVRVAANGKDAHLFISFYFYVFIFNLFYSTYRRTSRRGSHAYGEAQLLNFSTAHLFKVQPPRRCQFEAEAQMSRARQRTPQTEPWYEAPPTYTPRSAVLSSYIPSQVPVDAEPPPVCSNDIPYISAFFGQYQPTDVAGNLMIFSALAVSRSADSWAVSSSKVIYSTPLFL